jgi:hypothetical protein
MMLYYGGLEAEMAYRLEQAQSTRRARPRNPRSAWLRSRRRVR